MLDAGTYICPYCGHVDTIAYYKNSERRGGVTLKYLQNKHKKTFFIEQDRIAQEEGKSIRLLSSEYDVTVPRSISVYYDESSIPEQWVRYCPACREYPLPSSYGLLPTYILVMTGRSGVGKTTYLNAFHVKENLDRLRKANFPYQLSADLYIESGTSGATNKDSLGSTLYFTITQKGKDVAGVFLIDTAGEGYKKRRLENLLPSLLNSNGRYSGIDGLIFMDSLNSADMEPLFLNTASSKSPEYQGEDKNVYNALRQNDLLTKLPIAYIRNFLDLFLSSPNHIQRVQCRDPKKKLPLLNKDTFTNGSSFKAKDLIPRVAMEDYLVRQLNSGLLPFLATDNPNCKGFMVQSCSNTSTGNDNYQNATNLYDPILWMLNTLGIFPIR